MLMAFILRKDFPQRFYTIFRKIFPAIIMFEEDTSEEIRSGGYMITCDMIVLNNIDKVTKYKT